ncbi:uncharacterized protein ATNIH1004_010784 [Aspergillus tanneri]|uniref:Subtelomeric hrmA-associated cluster protein AFUB-079030/YDR124W-like helical bundle domain-containing protein n=1 Tax=Aspergillus tanneri TaxID=1220188 RepID=A0A5M9M4C7_9EURO|nr:uncharacterized protein ATNIH1004_010784 [Aspergillus tanneri]KAA8641845.1 hypothetical protein ATNIH1004_010784 [Aspergillus tanneri]
MVVTPAVPGTGPIKRPSSALHDDYTGWETVPPAGATFRPSFNIPFAHYALIYLDNLGRLEVNESPSIREHNSTLFTPEVREKFLEVLGTKIGYHKPMLRRGPTVGVSAYGYGRPDGPRHPKRRRASPQEPGANVDFSDAGDELPPPPPSLPSQNMVALEIGNNDKVQEYYENALKHFQQINCRQIAKAFIKFIEPRKQVKHPYNGGKPRGRGAKGEKGDPEKTKPEWWPKDVIHREPDHLRKNERVRLLIHIMRKLSNIGITPLKLREVAYDSKRQLKETRKIEILDEILRVRRMEERYERGEIVVYVINRDATPKQGRGVVPSKERCQSSVTDESDEEEDVPTPSSSTEELSGSFTSAMDMNVNGQGPLQMGGERRPLFPLLEPMSLAEQTRPEHSFYSSSSDYTNGYGPQSIQAPVSSAMVSPHEQPQAFDYLTQASFSTSAPGDQVVSQSPAAIPMQHSISQFDTWTPSLRSNIFNPTDYGNAASQTAPPTHLTYQMPMPHAQDLAHGLSSMDPLNPRSPFRTGSLGHPHTLPSHQSTSA